MVIHPAGSMGRSQAPRKLYRFAHELVQRACYDMLLDEQKVRQLVCLHDVDVQSRLHRKIAELLSAYPSRDQFDDGDQAWKPLLTLSFSFRRRGAANTQVRCWWR